MFSCGLLTIVMSGMREVLDPRDNSTNVSLIGARTPPGRGENVEQAVALDRQRHARARRDLAADADRIASGFHDVDQNLRLDRLAFQRVLDLVLNRPRRPARDTDPSGIRYGNAAVPTDDLFRNGRAVRTCADPVGDHRRGEQAARSRLPDRYGYGVADADHRFGRDPAVAELGGEASVSSPPERLDGRGRDIDDEIALVLVGQGLLRGDVARAWA